MKLSRRSGSSKTGTSGTPTMSWGHRSGEDQNSPIPFDHGETAGTIFQRLGKVLRHCGDRPAVVDEGGTLTYAELDASIDRVAREIVDRRGAGAEPVCTLLEGGIGRIVAALAIIKTGKFFIVLDPEMPAQRVRSVLDHTGASLLVTNDKNRRFAARVAQGGCRVLNLDRIRRGETPQFPPVRSSPDALAALFYTSGSTGEPKGVMVTRKIVLHSAWRYTVQVGVRVGDRQGLFNSLVFEGAVPKVFGTLLNGATLCLLNPRNRGIAEIESWIASNEITILNPPVSQFRQMLAHISDPHSVRTLRSIVVGGQAIYRRDVDAFRALFPGDCTILYKFGLSEAGSIAYIRIDHDTELTDDRITFCRAALGREIHIWDEGGEDLGFDRKGEIVVRSRFVTPGYWRDPVLTAERILPDPEGDGSRYFRTGDMGILRPDGHLEFSGRRDLQVKVRGYRVELNEVEDALHALPAVREAAVVARPTQEGETRLIAYVVPARSARTGGAALRAGLKAILPDYMIPSRFFTLARMPKTPSGKIDRLALADRDEGDRADDVARPRDGLELTLLSIWEEVLDVHPVGIHDDFFALGGQSILALRLFALIERRTGTSLPMATIFQFPTVEKLATVMRRKGWVPRWTCLVPIQPDGSDTPLFYVPPAAMTVLGAGELPRYLGKDQPLYGFQPLGLDRSYKRPHGSVEEMAAHYIAEMREVQPDGPYKLAGSCFGGIVAFEMARQLRRAGQEVALLALLDTLEPPGAYRTPGWVRKSALLGHAPPRTGSTDTVASAFRKLKKHWRERRRELPGILIGAFRRRLSYFLARLRVRTGRLFMSARRRRVERVKEAHVRAQNSYKPGVYDGRIVCFWTADTWQRVTRRRGEWSAYSTRDLEIHYIPGKHPTFMREPHVRELAEGLRGCLADPSRLVTP